MFLDPKSYVSQYRDVAGEYYPDEGQTVLLFFSGNITKHNLHSMDQVLDQIQDQEKHNLKHLDPWLFPYEKYFKNQLGHSEELWDDAIDLSTIESSLVQFLFSPSGGKFQFLFTFDEDLECGKELPKLQVWIEKM